MDQREVVECAHGIVCHSPNYPPDHHGWDCPLSDPVGDVLRAYGDRLANPLLESARQKMMAPLLKVEP